MSRLENSLRSLSFNFVALDLIIRLLNTSLGGNWSGIVPYGQKKVYRGRAHALMLFKDFKATGDLTIDSVKLVSTEDLPAFACLDLFNIKRISNRCLLERLLKNDRGVRCHFGGSWRLQDHGTNTMKYHLQHEVMGLFSIHSVINIKML